MAILSTQELDQALQVAVNPTADLLQRQSAATAIRVSHEEMRASSDSMALIMQRRNALQQSQLHDISQVHARSTAFDRQAYEDLESTCASLRHELEAARQKIKELARD